MNTHSKWYGNSLLTITAIIWGLAFVAQSAGMKYVGPFTFQCVRCALGAMVVFPLMVWRLKKRSPSGINITREMLIGGLLCGLAFTVAAVLQQIGH